MNELIYTDKAEDQFMKTFKYYKSNSSPPSLDEIINIDVNNRTDKVLLLSPNNLKIEDTRTKQLGLIEPKHWCLYSFRDHPGLFLIRNPFTSHGQRYWIEKCLKIYPRKPNKRNIDIETSVDDWWEACHLHGQCDKKLLKKLRWSTLGYHHNWDTKVYTEDNKSQFPEELSVLCDIVAGYLGYVNFKAEAAIVNYYHMNSTLSAHTDHSEVNLEAPLFSFSFGQSAIFLIGGTDKTTVPSAILLNSGDILVMSEAARLCYHAVPKILPSVSSPWNDDDGINDDWHSFEEYIKESRINMNVRQVLNETQCSL
ncbi:nucleic acid dioxygenase ALKBH1 [Achroia grisella]|uniref:nucleic acid dioxygenase ALKBH1 n=1 Tax=Achroia grisella TaxID=688607 RepID=UPI0027D1F9AB|nr:nucleic acid dioxygenase ALKBH1 [Achroia grisella]